MRFNRPVPMPRYLLVRLEHKQARGLEGLRLASRPIFGPQRDRPHPTTPDEQLFRTFEVRRRFLDQATDDNETRRRRQIHHSEYSAAASPIAQYANTLRRWVRHLFTSAPQRARSCTEFSSWAERGGNFLEQDSSSLVKAYSMRIPLRRRSLSWRTITKAFAQILSVRQR